MRSNPIKDFDIQKIKLKKKTFLVPKIFTYNFKNQGSSIAETYQ